MKPYLHRGEREREREYLGLKGNRNPNNGSRNDEKSFCSLEGLYNNFLCFFYGGLYNNWGA